MLINKSTDHHLKIVVRKVPCFYKLCENPECFFLTHNLQQPPNYHVKSLAVVYLCVSHSIRSAYSFYFRQCQTTFFRLIIEKLFIGKGSVDVLFDLTECWVRVAN